MNEESTLKQSNKYNSGTIYFMVVVPFLLNDFSSIFFTSYKLWVLVDYVCRLAALGFIGFQIHKRNLSLPCIHFSFHRKDRLLYWSLFLSVLVFIYSALSHLFLSELASSWKLSNVEYDKNTLLYLFDMTVGLGLVALSEEIIFRGLALSAIEKVTKKPLYILGVSSLVFALIHWSTGLKNMIDCFILGILFMAVTMRTKSIIPASVTHFILDYMALS